MTHAFFKSLLFLGAGSVMHALHSLDMYEMGGLYKKMKTTAITFLIASLSIAGVFPLAGFWSKDEIIADAFRNGYNVVLGVLLVTAFLTAFYMFRACFLTFFGEYRGKAHPHESPKVMTIPMIVLTFFAATAGLIGSPFLGNFFSKHIYLHHPHVPELNYILMFISLIVALSGIGVAYIIYREGPQREQKAIEKIGSLYTLVQNKYYIFDKRIIDGIVNGAAVVIKSLSQGIGIFDLRIVDGVVNGIAWLNKRISEGARRIQTGNVQSYAVLTLLGEIIVIIAIMTTVYYGVP
jgi:NADH-quinone oxidoreductase subunit L